MSSLKNVPFGDPTPFAEPSWYRDWDSPYYNDSHRAFRQKVRDFVEKECRPFVDEWEERHISEGFEVPLELYRKAYAAGVYSPQFPPELGGTPPPGGFDAFHDLILNDELARIGSAGISSGFSIYTMALPPVLDSGNKAMIDLVARDVLTAKKFISLCITEPYAGSDVSNIKATARREGDYYILNAEKKWITWGVHASFFTVAARTGEAGMKGLSLFLVPRELPGITVTRMKLQGSWLAGTSVVQFNDVKVPVANLLGKEGDGFKMIMRNFNHERFTIVVGANRGSRMLIEESVKYALQRRTFGKRLIEHQVIRSKIADMAMRVEAVQALIENITYQMSRGVSAESIAGPVAMAKVLASRTLELCAREASQIFGGNSYTRGGRGQGVERAYREVRGVAIPGGSEEIMADFAIRQAIQNAQKVAAARKSKL